MGTILICGCGPSLHEDIAASRRRTVPRIAVNGAAAVIIADYLFTLHTEIIARYAAQQAALRSERGMMGRPAELIAAVPERGPFTPHCFPIDHWMAIPERRATSGWAAIYAAIHLGFRDIVLCGVPLNGGEGAAAGTGSDFGDKPAGGPTIMRVQAAARQYAAELSRAHPAVSVHSMSGFTREILGLPKNMLDTPAGTSEGARHGRRKGRRRE